MNDNIFPIEDYFTEASVENSIHHKSDEGIQIDGSIIITKDNWGQLDKPILSNWTSFGVYPLLLEFNQITNPFTIRVGEELMIPDFQELMKNMKQIDLNHVVGVVDTMDSSDYNKQQSKIETNKKTTEILPKIGLNLRKVKYDSETGKIIF